MLVVKHTINPIDKSMPRVIIIIPTPKAAKALMDSAITKFCKDATFTEPPRVKIPKTINSTTKVI